MNEYIAFLRGINVGGKNKIPMVELKEGFEECGFLKVRTYINSGNVIFLSDILDETMLKQMCEALIEKKFQLKILVAIISVVDLKCAIENAPDWWNREVECKHNAIILIPPITAQEVFEEVGEIKPEYEKVGYYGKVVFWSAPIETFSRTRWSKVVGSSIYDNITIRNANTVNKILQMVT